MSINNNESKKNIIEFPCAFVLKIFGKHGANYIEEAKRIVLSHFPDTNEGKFIIKDSKESKYCAISVEVNAESQQQLDAAYIELSSCPDILMVL
jgi:putative lipoic acid-binding regulatory protein